MSSHCWCVTCPEQEDGAGKGIFTVAGDVDDLMFQGSSTGQTSFNDALGPLFLGFFQVFLKLFGQSAGG